MATERSAYTDLEDDETTWLTDSTRRSSQKREVMQKLWLCLLALIGLGAAFGLGMLVDRSIISEAVPEFPVPCRNPFRSAGPKNLIFMVTDGMGPAAVTLARIMKGQPLAMDNYLIATMRTPSFDSNITDSAAAATAMATGFKTYNDAMGIFPNQTAAGTIMEAAHEANWDTGVITTTGVYDATPGSFTAHANYRSYYSFIANQQVQKGLDVILGGGRVAFTNETLSLAASLGYNYVTNKQDLAVADLPVLGLFSERDLAPVQERDLFPDEPDLYTMTSRALELLEDRPNSNGFFLVVENEDTDNFAHVTDFTTVYRSILDFERTFQLVMDFAQRRNDTLVLLTSDHETAGLGLGLNGNLDFNPEALTKPTRSSRYSASQLLGETNLTVISEKTLLFTGFNITEQQATEISEISDESLLEEYFSQIVDKQALIGNTTTGHTACDVNVYGYGPGVEMFCGNFDNTEISKRIAKLFNWDVQSVTDKLKDFITHP